MPDREEQWCTSCGYPVYSQCRFGIRGRPRHGNTIEYEFRISRNSFYSEVTDVYLDEEDFFSGTNDVIQLRLLLLK